MCGGGAVGDGVMVRSGNRKVADSEYSQTNADSSRGSCGNVSKSRLSSLGKVVRQSAIDTYIQSTSALLLYVALTNFS